MGDIGPGCGRFEVLPVTGRSAYRGPSSVELADLAERRQALRTGRSRPRLPGAQTARRSTVRARRTARHPPRLS